MGTAVIGGMLAATVIAIFLIPASFYFVEKYFVGKKKEERGGCRTRARGRCLERSFAAI